MGSLELLWYVKLCYFNFDVFIIFLHVLQDNIKELLNVVTISNYVREREAYVVLKGASKRIGTQLLNRKMKLIRGYVQRAESVAENIIAEGDRQCAGIKRPLTR
jgi:hypothetical protein